MMYVVSKIVTMSEKVYDSDIVGFEEYPKKDAFTNSNKSEIIFSVYDDCSRTLYDVHVERVDRKRLKSVNRRNLKELFFNVYITECHIKFEVAFFRGNGNVYRSISMDIMNRIVSCILDFEEKSRKMQR